ncbi:MAG: 4'-phosphopantetheinyl transferase superfamily protein [Cyanobacteria bacterium SBLK]|nr:4'-phosphopantetheinyl transferase superfamily protein [Cyanobacteria bacterium SBLK]
MPRSCQGRIIKAVGIDLVEIAKIEGFIERYDREILALVFASEELDASRLAPKAEEYLALCFASKEAIGKALATGLAEINWFDIAAKLDSSGRLSVNLLGSARQKANELGLQQWEMSWVSWQHHLLVRAIAYQ